MLGLLSAGHQARHLGLLWIATEAITLATVPLLHFNGTPRAFEATWKYLLVGGTGIALSLLGSFCLGYASLHGGGGGDLTFTALDRARRRTVASVGVDRVGFVARRLRNQNGPGADAHLETGCLRRSAGHRRRAPGGRRDHGGVHGHPARASGRGRRRRRRRDADRTLLAIGLFSMLVAALFLLGTRDFKRMLAYSSVEHMGILAVGAALGGAGVWAALFHVWSNALTKGSLFLSAGNIRRAAGARNDGRSARHVVALAACRRRMFVIGHVRGHRLSALRSVLQRTARAARAFDTGHWLRRRDVSRLPAVGVLRHDAAWSLPSWTAGRAPPRGRPANAFPKLAGVIVPPLLLLGLSLWLGLFTPAVLREAWSAAVAQLFPDTMSAPRHFALLSQRHQPAVGGSAGMAGGGIRRAPRRPNWIAARASAPGSACRKIPATRLVAVLAFDADNTLAVGRSAAGRRKSIRRSRCAIRRRICSSAKSGNSTVSCPKVIRG